MFNQANRFSAQWILVVASNGLMCSDRQKVPFRSRGEAITPTRAATMMFANFTFAFKTEQFKGMAWMT